MPHAPKAANLWNNSEIFRHNVEGTYAGVHFTKKDLQKKWNALSPAKKEVANLYASKAVRGQPIKGGAYGFEYAIRCPSCKTAIPIERKQTKTYDIDCDCGAIIRPRVK
jgi:hypothetical protein